jgi:hypothetical protein
MSEVPLYAPWTTPREDFHMWARAGQALDRQVLWVQVSFVTVSVALRPKRVFSPSLSLTLVDLSRVTRIDPARRATWPRT